MKKLILFAIIATVTLFSCKKDDATNNDTTSANDQLTARSWHVDSFTIGDDDQSGEFRDYAFTFMTDGTSNAANSFVSIPGTWKTASENSSTTLTLSYYKEGFALFSNISGKYVITERSATRFVLTREVPDNGGQRDVLIITGI